MKRDRLYLLLIWLLLGLLMAALSAWHPTHATSPDSAHYLRLAMDWRTYNGIFPPGYSLLIGLISSITSLSGLWASKLVNWLALGFFGWAWAGRVGARSVLFLLGIWLLPANLRIATYTWSETVFIALLLEAIWWSYRLSIHETRANAFRVAGLLVALVWVRYVGLFMIVYLMLRRTAVRRTAVRRTATLYILVYIFGIALLLTANVALTGYLFGGVRLLPTEPWDELLRMMAVAVLNEILLYNYRPGMAVELFGSALLGQILVLAMLIRYVRRKGVWIASGFTSTPLVHHLFGVGLLYFLTLFMLRSISPFDPLNERLMAPGSVCWLMALVLVGQSQHSIISKSPVRAETLTNPS